MADRIDVKRSFMPPLSLTPAPISAADIAWRKHSHDQAMTLRELSIVSGYGYSTLKGMQLPLISGKISPTDFRRVVRRRQDEIELSRGAGPASPTTAGPIESPPHPRLTADKLHAPR